MSMHLSVYFNMSILLDSLNEGDDHCLSQNNDIFYIYIFIFICNVISISELHQV
jgi:hypothetical protein